MPGTIFLDRDGVINEFRKQVNKPRDIIVYEKSKEGLKRAYDAEYALYIVTNQGGIELGFLSKEELEKIHEYLLSELEPYCKITAIKYCPDYKKKSNCRKPEPGMILELAEEYNINLNNSWMVGDMDTDVEAGKRAGCKTAKIGKSNSEAEVNGENLLEVIEKIIEWDKTNRAVGISRG